MRRCRSLAIVTVLSIGLGACAGHDDRDAAAAARVIDVEMAEMTFTPATITVSAGEIVRFRFANVGTVDHEATIGDAAEQARHAEEMAQRAAAGTNSAHRHGDAAAVTVAPGKTASLTHTFTIPGTIVIGCHQPGHYEAGMKAEIGVS